MDIEVMQSDDVTVIALTGDLDLAVADRIRRTLIDLVDAGHVRLVVDLAAVSSVDSSAMGALIEAVTYARSRGGDLRLAALPRDVRALFERTHLHKAFAVEPTRQQAVASW